MNWLDTETKAILQKSDDPKLAPPKAGEFALVLLQKGTSDERLIHALREINDCTEIEARHLAGLPVPVTVNHGLTEGEALYGQFELICCDAVAAFLRSEVLSEPDRNYLDSLWKKVLASHEFKPVKVDVLDVPMTESGEKFVEQFLGISSPGLHTGTSVLVSFKKARIMKHWAVRIGANVRCDAVQVVQNATDVF